MIRFITFNDFSKGMVNSVTPDANYEVQSWRTGYVKYLENLNPNIINRALVRREAVSTLEQPCNTAISLLDKCDEHEEYISVQMTSPTDIYYACNSYVDLVSKGYIDPLVLTNPMDYILGNVVIKAIEPTDSTPIFVMLKYPHSNIEETRIIGYYAIGNPTKWAWNEPHVDMCEDSNTGLMRPYMAQGGTMPAYMMDRAIRSQCVLLVGIPNQATLNTPSMLQYLLPIYIWTYENLSKVKSAFIDLTDATIYDLEKWKFKNSWKTLIGNIGEVALMLPPERLNQWELMENWNGGSSTGGYNTTIDTNDATTLRVTENRRAISGLNTIEVVFWQSEFAPKHKTGIVDLPNFGTVNDFIYQLEDVVTEKFILTAYTRKATTSEGYYWHGPSPIWHLPKKHLNSTVAKYARVKLGENYPTSITEDVNKDLLVPYDPLNLIPSKEPTYEELSDLETLVEFTNEGSFGCTVSINALPNYIEKGIPRQWCKGEIIYYKLTAMLDGTEIEVSSGSYTVAGGNENTDSYIASTPITNIVQLAGESIIGAQTIESNLLSSSYRDVYYKGSEYLQVSTDTDTLTPFIKEIADKMEIQTKSTYVTGLQVANVSSKYPYIYFTLRIPGANPEDIGSLLLPNLSQLRLYISMPKPDEQLINDTVKGIYNRTYKQNDESVEYALVKIFDVTKRESETDVLDSAFVNFAGSDQGLLAVDYGKWIFTNQSVTDVSGNEQTAHGEGAGWYFVPKSYTQSEFNPDTNEESKEWTPDFCLWDYPQGVLYVDNLGDATTLWNGVGARLVEVIKSRPFIGGCLDKDGKEEIGRIRYAIRQNTTISNDKFAELNFIDVGKFAHTAFASYREQLWAFSRYQVHRIQFPDITDDFTFEVLDAFEGHGTFSPKTVCVASDGVYWLNESGVCYSDGRDAQVISAPIEAIYLAMLGTTRYNLDEQYFECDDNDIIDGYNKTIEINYDMQLNDIIISSRVISGEDIDPVSKFKLARYSKEMRLIYNITYKNWRCESLGYPDDDDTEYFGKITNLVTTNYNHKMRFSLDKEYNTRVHDTTFGISETSMWEEI